MLVQPAEDGQTVLLPSWPCEWSADFDVRGHGGVRINGRLSQGQLKYLGCPVGALVSLFGF